MPIVPTLPEDSRGFGVMLDWIRLTKARAAGGDNMIAPKPPGGGP